MDQIAVLTGDLIASTAADGPAVDRTMQALSGAARILGNWAGHDTRFTRFRGDGWQFYLASPGLVLRAVLFLTAYLRAADTGLATRISAATGSFDHLGQSGLSAASGPAFSASGRTLDAMPRSRRVSVTLPGQAAVWKGAVLDLAEWQASHWSREQASAVVLALDPTEPTQGQIAASLGITRQAVQARLKGAGLAALHSALLAFETEKDAPP
jgi:hypothetical protein